MSDFATEAYKACLYGKADPQQQQSVASALILANGEIGRQRERAESHHANLLRTERDWAEQKTRADMLAKAYSEWRTLDTEYDRQVRYGRDPFELEEPLAAARLELERLAKL